MGVGPTLARRTREFGLDGMSARAWAAMLKAGKGEGEPFGVVLPGAGATAGLVGWSLPSCAPSDGDGVGKAALRAGGRDGGAAGQGWGGGSEV